MDCRQAGYEIRWRALGFCNGLVRRVLTARNNAFTWNVAAAGIRYCPNKEPTPSLYQFVSNNPLSSSHGSVRRLRDMAPNTSLGFASMRERRLFSFHQEQLAVKPLKNPLTLMTLATFNKDQIFQTLSDICGRPVNSANYRTTFLQYLQLCRKIGLQFKVQLSAGSTQCLTCLQHATVPFHRFRCDCILFRFSRLQDCNCECGTSYFCCTCDDIPPLCYDLDVLADIVTVYQRFFESLFHTDQIFMELAMSCTVQGEFPGVRELDVLLTIRPRQYEPP